MKWTVSNKLRMAFASIIVLLVIVGLLGLWASIALNSKYENLLENNVEKVQIIDEFILKQKEIQGDVRGFILFKDTDYLQSIQAYIERSDELMDHLERDLQDTYSAQLEMLKEARGKFMTLQNDIVANLEVGKERKAIELGRASSNISAIVLENAEIIKADQLTAMNDARDELNRYMNGIIIFVLGLILIAIVVGVIISTVIARSISRPVKVVTEGLNAIANGDFTIEDLHVKNKDEIGVMAQAFNKMGADVANMIRKMNTTVIHLASQSEQLSASSEESLASSEMVAKTAEQQLIGSEQQQQIIEQSASSMNELSLGVAEIATSNEEMLQSAESMTKYVSQGSAVVEDVSTQMAMIYTKIKESTEIIEEMARNSNEIQKVTGLITNIAEQTNLLALNAAIEAARAGEYGKGFAVVADEVRHLAEQSKVSAAEIEAMVNTIQQASTMAVTSISSSSERIGEGIAATNQSRKVFTEIEEAVGDVSSKIQTVSAAIEQIQAMADEVSYGASTVRHLSTQVAVAASDTSAATEEQLAVNEEITSSAVELAKLAEELQAEVKKFKV